MHRGSTPLKHPIDVLNIELLQFEGCRNISEIILDCAADFLTRLPVGGCESTKPLGTAVRTVDIGAEDFPGARTVQGNADVLELDLRIEKRVGDLGIDAGGTAGDCCVSGSQPASKSI